MLGQLQLRALVTNACQPRLGTHHLGHMPRRGQGQQRKVEDRGAQSRFLEKLASMPVGKCLRHVTQNLLESGCSYMATLGLEQVV